MNNDKSRRKMAAIDALSPEMRACVHEVGWGLVKEFMECGVHDPKVIIRLTKVVMYETTAARLMQISKKST